MSGLSESTLFLVQRQLEISLKSTGYNDGSSDSSSITVTDTKNPPTTRSRLAKKSDAEPTMMSPDEALQVITSCIEGLDMLKKELSEEKNNTSNIQTKSHSRSRSYTSSRASSRNQLQNLSRSNSRSGSSLNNSKSIKELICKNCIMAFDLLKLYNINSNLKVNLEIDKKHSNFILRLIELDMIETALLQLWKLYKRINNDLLLISHSSLEIDTNNIRSKPRFENLLCYEIPTNTHLEIPTTLSNIIITSSIFLLQCLSKLSLIEIANIDFSIDKLINCFLPNNINSPISWCNNFITDKTTKETRLKYFSKLLLIISDKQLGNDTKSIGNNISKFCLSLLSIIINPMKIDDQAKLEKNLKSLIQLLELSIRKDPRNLYDKCSELVYYFVTNVNRLKSDKMLELVTIFKSIQDNEYIVNGFNWDPIIKDLQPVEEIDKFNGLLRFIKHNLNTVNEKENEQKLKLYWKDVSLLNQLLNHTKLLLNTVKDKASSSNNMLELLNILKFIKIGSNDNNLTREHLNIIDAIFLLLNNAKDSTASDFIKTVATPLFQSLNSIFSNIGNNTNNPSIMKRIRNLSNLMINYTTRLKNIKENINNIIKILFKMSVNLEKQYIKISSDKSLNVFKSKSENFIFYLIESKDYKSAIISCVGMVSYLLQHNGDKTTFMNVNDQIINMINNYNLINNNDYYKTGLKCLTFSLQNINDNDLKSIYFENDNDSSTHEDGFKISRENSPILLSGLQKKIKTSSSNYIYLKLKNIFYNDNYPLFMLFIIMLFNPIISLDDDNSDQLKKDVNQLLARLNDNEKYNKAHYETSLILNILSFQFFLFQKEHVDSSLKFLELEDEVNKFIKHLQLHTQQDIGINTYWIEQEKSLFLSLLDLLFVNGFSGPLITLTQIWEKNRKDLGLDFSCCYYRSRAYLDLGFVKNATIEISKINNIIKKQNRNSKLSNPKNALSYFIMIFKLKLLQLECCLIIGNANQSNELLSSILKFVDSTSDSVIKIPVQFDMNEIVKQEFNLDLSYLSHLSSLLMNLNGKCCEAIIHSKRSIKISRTLLSKINSVSITSSNYYTILRLKWNLSHQIVSSFLQTSVSYCNIGMGHDAEFYIQEALKILMVNKWCQSSILFKLSCVEFYTSFDKVQLAMDLINEIEEEWGKINFDDKWVTLCYYKACALLYHKIGDNTNEMSSYSKISEMMNEEHIIEQFKTLSISTASENDSLESSSNNDITNFNNLMTPVYKSGLLEKGEFPKLLRLKTDIMNQTSKYDLLLKYDSLDPDKNEINKFDLQSADKATYKSKMLKDVILYHIAIARKNLAQAKRVLSTDPIFSILRDSAISVPSISGLNEQVIAKSGFNPLTPSNTKSRGKKVTHSKSITPNVKVPKYSSKQESKCVTDATEYLTIAKDLFLDCSKKAFLVCTTAEIHDIAKLLHTSLTTLSAVSPCYTLSILSTFAEIMEIPRIIPLHYEKQLSLYNQQQQLLQQQQQQSRHFYLPSDIESFSLPVEFLNDKFEKKTIELLPRNWSVISIDICPYTGDLLLSKYNSKTTPFIIRLPTNRQMTEDNDESFSFSDGLKELYKIIEESDETARRPKNGDIKTKEDRKLWWNDRYELDNKLQKLLHDAEYCWLGGFRGIFQQKKRDSALMGKFRHSFVKTLKKYLPSRRLTRNRNRGTAGKRKGNLGDTTQSENEKGRKKKLTINDLSSEGQLEIDDRVLELFIGLGDPTNWEGTELLEDLIYFVLDILLFHGEQNAYDEIDIDQLYVEIEESLKIYHNEVERLQHSDVISDYEEASVIDHTILVLGKECHSFPWESLPCLRQLSISRMPSLMLLENLLQNYRDGDFSNDYNDMCISVSSSKGGKFILNPGGDLKRTEDIFRPEFVKLGSDWSGLINEKPTEEQVLSSISESSIYIYIGHGGGEQYVRSSKIKQLPHCSPTFLLGCSSGKLNNGGEFEPWGTSFAYLIAGCPMLVANMWDVTDKDIDRFSISMLEKWGLFNHKKDSTKMNIAESVANSRNECMLKFLNGAAPVIYGLPLQLQL